VAPYLARIAIFPIKALNGLVVPEAYLLPTGPLANDRRWAIMDSAGRPLNGKRTPLVHQLHPHYAPDLSSVRFTTAAGEEAGPFSLGPDRQSLTEWLSHYFGQPVQVLEDAALGFPDDRPSPGPTVVSTATLEAITCWFPGLTLEEVRARFRANLEIGGVEPFWEDHLIGEPGQVIPFQIGSVTLLGVNPCRRCVVPTRNPWTGAAWSGFIEHFRQQREHHLPPWAPRRRFDHFYRLAVNTRPASAAGGFLAVGAAVRVGAPQPA
jgi:uncharacterized protein YcbX